MRSSLAEDMEEFRKVGADVSYFQSQMHSEYESSESITDSDFEDENYEECRKIHLTVTSLQCQCLSWLMIDQGNLWKSKPIKPKKTNKKVTTTERGNPLDSEIPEWLQEFRENLVDDEIPLQGGSHSSSSHEVSLEPTTKRREDLGKHNVHTHFPKDRNCEICKRTKITRAHAEDAMAKSYLVQKILVT